MPGGIAYQNKDIEFKVLSEAYKERSFEAYGLKLPRIKAVLPTNLPVVSADEMRMDNLFLLEDGTYAIVDYESTNALENRIKYINYIPRVVKKLYEDYGKMPVIRMIVIYTGDILTAEPLFDVGCMMMRMEQVFVRSLPTEAIYQSIKRKLEDGIELTETELMQLIILPLAEKGKKGKQERIRQVIDLAKQIEDEKDQKLVFAGLLVISDKFISKENADAIRREISMTKVGRLIYEDGLTVGREEGRKEGMEKERIRAVINLLGYNVPEEKILENYSEDNLREAKRVIKQGDQYDKNRKVDL